MAQFNPNLVLVNPKGQLTREGYELLEGIAASIADNGGLSGGELAELVASALAHRDSRDEEARTLALMSESRQPPPNMDWLALLAGRREQAVDPASILAFSNTARLSALQKKVADELTWLKDGIDIYYDAGTVAIGGAPTSAALSVYGDLAVSYDIVVSGSVNGRNIIVDGFKLDGIESGATADQTASEILTKIKTVDGAGSGLDADTVDGLHAEEGTFTPVVYGSTGAGTATYTVQAGTWTRIGNRVWFDLEVAYSGHTGTGKMRISGLPFTAAAGIFPACSVWQNNLVYAGQLGAWVRANTDEVLLVENGGANSLDIDAAASVNVSGSYTV